MGVLTKFKGIIAENKNLIYLFLFFNYVLLFLFKTAKLPFLGFQSNKKLAVFVYLYHSLRGVLEAGLFLQFFVLGSAVLAYFILVYSISWLIVKFANKWNLQQKLGNLRIIRQEYLIVLFLFAFSALIRFAFLNAGLYHHDSFQLAVAVEKTDDEGSLYGIGGGRHGIVLINVLFYYFFKVFLSHQSAEFTVNFTAALFGALAVPVLYLLVKNLFNGRFMAFSSSMLYSVTPVFLSASTFAKEHTLDVLISLLSIYMLIIGLKKTNYIIISLSGLLLSSLIFVRFPSILIAFSSAFLIFIFGKAGKIKALSSYLAPFAALIIVYLSFSNGAFFTEAKSNFNQLSPESLKFVLLNNLWYSAEGIIFTLTTAGLALALAGFLLLFKENKKLLCFLLLFFAPLFAFYAPSKTVAHRFFALPIVALVIPLSYTLSSIRKKELLAGLLIFIALAAAFFINIYPVIKFRHQFSAFKEFAKMVNENVDQNSIVVLYGDDTPALNYYSSIPAMSCYYYQDAQSLDGFISGVQELMRRNLNVYISGACFGLGSQDEQAGFLGAMNGNFKGSIVAEYVSDDYHRGSIKPTIKKISMLKLYSIRSNKGSDISLLDIRY